MSDSLSYGMATRGTLRFTIDVSDFLPYFIIDAPLVRKQIPLAFFSDADPSQQDRPQVVTPPSAQIAAAQSVSLRSGQPIDMLSVLDQRVYNKKETDPLTKSDTNVVNHNDPNIFNKGKD